MWRFGAEGPEEGYHSSYWRRMRALDFEFTKLPLKQAVGIALRFTAFQPGLSTAIVGSSSPGRWAENAALLEQGPLSTEEVSAIRTRWKERAKADWVGQQ